MLYRGIEYTYKEWKNFNGKKCFCFSCSDEKLLAHVDATGISGNTLGLLQDKIDFYLENVDHHKRLRKLNDAAAAEFYKNK
jgi:hypothetical protein|tara:strand:+ start:153 stop:395 length:243 start_codon:yes stop_codon:yes gene_type:complete